MRTNSMEKCQNIQDAECVRDNICGRAERKKQKAHRCAICGCDDADKEFMDKYICENCRCYIAKHF